MTTQNQGEGIEHSELVEILVDDISAINIKFPTNNSLIENSFIKSIQVLSINSVAISPKNRPNVSLAILQKAFLNLKSKNTQTKLKTIPLVFLCPELNNGVLRKFKNTTADFTNSDIQVANSTGLVLGTSFVLNFIYEPIRK